MQIRLLFVTFLMFVSHLVFSQAKLSGKITDGETGAAIVGASVTITGEQKGVTTDVDGGFYISVQRNVKYSLTVSNVGYQTKEVGDIQVTDTDVPVVNITLEKSNQQLQEVVVKTSARRESVASLYNVQKLSSSISDGISADIIKKSPDRNTGDVLKRVSGASIQDNKFVIIRGLNERYNTALLNNAVLPSTEADTRAFSFDIIPSSAVDNLVIYKTPTPDLPGDFAGGAIKITTKDYPTSKLSELSFTAGYNTMTTFKSFYKNPDKGNLDFLGFLDDSRLIPGPYYRNISQFINKTDDFKTAVTKMFPNTFGFKNANNSLPNLSLSYTGGNTKLMSNNNKLGYIFSLGYGTSRQVSERTRDEYLADKSLRYSYTTTNYDQKSNLNALLNLTYSYGKSKLSFKNLFNNDFTSSLGLRNGYDVSNGEDDKFLIKSNLNHIVQNGIVNSVLEGAHSLNNGWKADWTGSFSYTYRNEPDQRILNFRTRSGQTDNFFLPLGNQNSPAIDRAGRVYSFLNENIYGASANVIKEFQWLNLPQIFKFGTANYYRKRNVEVDAIGYASLSAGGVDIPEPETGTFSSVFTNDNIDNYGITVGNILNNSASYKGDALLNAGYVMLDNKLAPSVKLTWGVRVENYRQELNALDNRSTSVDKPISNFDVLPSVLFTYSLNPKSNLRLAGSQSVNRPEFRELTNYIVYDYDLALFVAGNPELRRSKNSNLDLRYEWFPGAGQIISASLFYKKFDNPIERVNLGNDFLSYQNAKSSEVYGAEVEIRKKLDFFQSDFLERLSLYVNAAYMKGSIKFENMLSANNPMQGQSPYLINTGITYSDREDKFMFNLLYNRIGPRLSYRGQDGALNIYEKPRDVIDAQISRKFLNKKLEVKATVSDILAQPFNWYYKFDPATSNIGYDEADSKIMRSTKLGTSASLTIKYLF
ncbi:TonB-dependent receptor [Niabella beijingensis]|uniref:TonB-dependent receptor n=1 Tax=Niabella beijingensis TaxID=2872700 RepID=UPI001CBD4B7E|nr:TonB-dependent receptor [Niabella beijingensis]MBZ4189487.1 outer membrane beta-barrel protein [Niabella beijingensis]